MLCQHEIVSKRCRVKTMFMKPNARQHDVLSTQKSCQCDAVPTRHNANMLSCQDDSVLKRCRVKTPSFQNDTASTHNRVNATPRHHTVVPTWCRVNTMLCQIDIVTTQCRTKTTCQHGPIPKNILPTLHRVPEQCLVKKHTASTKKLQLADISTRHRANTTACNKRSHVGTMPYQDDAV